jgi:hypothetical protein
MVIVVMSAMATTTSRTAGCWLTRPRASSPRSRRAPSVASALPVGPLLVRLPGLAKPVDPVRSTSLEPLLARETRRLWR